MAPFAKSLTMEQDEERLDDESERFLIELMNDRKPFQPCP